MHGLTVTNCSKHVSWSINQYSVLTGMCMVSIVTVRRLAFYFDDIIWGLRNQCIRAVVVADKFVLTDVTPPNHHIIYSDGGAQIQ